MSINIALIITSIVFAILIIIGAFYFLVYFQHPDDKWVAWWPKIVVVLSISLACFNVFLLPLDSANQGGSFVATGGIPMAQITIAFFISSIIVAVAIVPFAMYYYEGMDESDEYDNDVSKQIFYAIQWTVITLTIYFSITAIVWAFLGWAYIPVSFQYNSFKETSDYTFDFSPDKTDDSYLESKLVKVPVSFLVYMITTASLVGWVMFSAFGGVGLPALPFDLLMDYKNRPKRIKLEEYTDKKKLIGEQASLLLQASAGLIDEKKKVGKAKNFQNSKQRQYKRKENEFKRDVLFLESQYKRLEDGYKNGGGNPLFYWAELFVGAIGSIISLLWFIHLMVYVLPLLTTGEPVNPFLNDFLNAVFDVPFIGISLYGLFSFWLLLCVFKGVTKMGLRFLFITIHPIQYGETMMSSLVFNCGLMLFCSLAVTQFCTVAFGQFAKYTSVLSLFGNQIKYFYVINYLYNILAYVLLILSFISLIYVWVKPYDQKVKPLI